MRSILSIFFLCLAAMAAFAQSAPVSGIVVDEKGEPLIGVTVKVSGTTIGTSTDIDGKFTINMPGKKGVLIFSYVGYRPKNIDVASGQKIETVKLEPVNTH